MNRLRSLLGRHLASGRHMLPVLLVVFLGACVSTYLASNYTSRVVEDLAKDQTRQSLDFLDHEVTAQVNEMLVQTRLLSQERVLRLALEDSFLGESARVAAQRKLEDFLKDRLYERFYLMNRKGVILLASEPDLAGRLDVSDRAYFLRAIQGHSHLETIGESRVSKRPILVASHPVPGPDGAAVGVLVAISDTSDFGSELLDMIRIGRKGGAFFLDQGGKVLALPPWPHSLEVDPGDFSQDIVAGARDGQTVRYARQDSRRMCFARINAKTGWVLAVEADEAELFAPVARLATVNAGVALLTLALVALALNALRKTMATLRDSEADQRALTELSPVGIVSFDSQGRPVSLNRQAREILDLPPGSPLPEAIALTDEHGAPLSGDASPVETALARHTSVIDRPAWLDTPSGGRKALTISATPLSGQSAGGFALVATLDDVTERKRSLERLHQSEQRFSKLFRLSPEASLLLDAHTLDVLDVNEAFQTLTGYTAGEMLGRAVHAVAPGIDREKLAAFQELLLRGGRVDNLEFEGRRKDGQPFIAAVSAQVIENGPDNWLMVLLRDITETKQIHEMMIQTEKMISVGGIAAGIAHEINNPLGIVLQAAQNLVQRTRPDFGKNIEAARKVGVEMELVAGYVRERKLDVFIQDIQSAAARASGIIRHMLDFSRRSESRRMPSDLRAILEKAVALAASDYDLRKSYDFKRIAIERDFADNLPLINCTETEIEQVFLNLLRNSAQALATADPPVEKPRIRIRVTHLPDRLRVELADNGPGIPADIQKRIFEPFYTTKPPGVGTGLGLSVSYFIVTKGHGGAMRVASRPGEGAAFIVELPTGDALEQ